MPSRGSSWGRGSATRRSGDGPCEAVDGAALVPPGNRNLAGIIPGVGFTMSAGMSLINCRATNCASNGFLDVFSTLVAGTKLTLVNPEASNNVGSGIKVRFVERTTVFGGVSTGTPQTYGYEALTGTITDLFGIDLTGNVTGASTGAGTITTH